MLRIRARRVSVLAVLTSLAFAGYAAAQAQITTGVMR